MSKAKKIALDKNLQSLMEKHNFSISDLSRFCNVSKSSVHNWANGVNPKAINSLIKICEYFGITLDELIFSYSVSSSQNNLPVEGGRFEVIVRKI